MLSTRQFTYNPATRCFSAEASDFGPGGFANALGPVFNDACDIGFVLVSAKTGEECKVVLDREVHNADDDLEAWVFVPVARSLRRLFTVKIFND